MRRFENAVELSLSLQVAASFERSFVCKVSAVFFSSLCTVRRVRDVGACRSVEVRRFRKKLAFVFMTFY